MGFLDLGLKAGKDIGYSVIKTVRRPELERQAREEISQQAITPPAISPELKTNTRSPIAKAAAISMLLNPSAGVSVPKTEMFTTKRLPGIYARESDLIEKELTQSQQQAWEKFQREKTVKAGASPFAENVTPGIRGLMKAAELLSVGKMFGPTLATFQAVKPAAVAGMKGEDVTPETLLEDRSFSEVKGFQKLARNMVTTGATGTFGQTGKYVAERIPQDIVDSIAEGVIDLTVLGVSGAVKRDLSSTSLFEKYWSRKLPETEKNVLNKLQALGLPADLKDAAMTQVKRSVWDKFSKKWYPEKVSLGLGKKGFAQIGKKSAKSALVKKIESLEATQPGIVDMAEKIRSKMLTNIKELVRYPILKELWDRAIARQKLAEPAQAKVKQDIEDIKNALNLKEKQHETIKSVGSIASKVLRKGQHKEYGFDDISDYARGATVLDDLNSQYEAVAKILTEKGYKPIAEFGQMVWGGYIPLHWEKPGTEIQVHNKATWDYKVGVSDGFYHKNRHLFGKENLNDAEKKQLFNDDIESKTGWEPIYADLDLESIKATSAGVKASISVGSPSGPSPSAKGRQLPSAPSTLKSADRISTTEPLPKRYTEPLAMSSTSKESIPQEAGVVKGKEQVRLLRQINSLALKIPQVKGSGFIPPKTTSTPQQIDSVVSAIDSAIAADPVMFPIKDKPAITSNQDYGVSFDPENLCAKGYSFTTTLDALRKALDDMPAGVKTEAGRKLLELAGAEGLEVPCNQCYVAEKRILGSSAKSAEPGLSPYEPGEINSPGNSKYIQDNIVRMYSFGDFNPSHFPSVVKFLRDLEAGDKGAGAYVKNLNFVEILGDVGIKINISVGKTTAVGLPLDVVIPYLRRYPNTASVHVAVNNADVLEVGPNPDIHKIIPAHIGPGTPKELLNLLSGLEWESFTASQSEKIMVGNREINFFGKAAEGSGIPARKLEEARQKVKEGMYTGSKNKYLLAIKKASDILGMKITPKFPQFVQYDWYHKLIGSGQAEYGRTAAYQKIDLSKINVAKAERYFKNFPVIRDDKSKEYSAISERIINAARGKAEPTAKGGEIVVYPKSPHGETVARNIKVKSYDGETLIDSSGTNWYKTGESLAEKGMTRFGARQSGKNVKYIDIYDKDLSKLSPKEGGVGGVDAIRALQPRKIDLSEKQYGMGAEITDVGNKFTITKPITVTDANTGEKKVFTPDGRPVVIKRKVLDKATKKYEWRIEDGNDAWVTLEDLEKFGEYETQRPDKIRQFIETVKGAEKTAPEVKQAIDSRYIPGSNKEMVAKAQLLIETDLSKAYALANEENPSIEDVAFIQVVSTLLMDKAQAAGNFSEAIRLVNLNAQRGTATGQGSQVLSIYERLSPEGVLRYADSVIKDARSLVSKEKLAQWEKLVANLSDDKQKAELAKKLGIPYLSDDLVARLYDRAVNIRAIGTDVAKTEEIRQDVITQLKRSAGILKLSPKISNFVLGESLKNLDEKRLKLIEIGLLLKDITREVPVDMWDKVSFVQTLSMLLNPKTAARNMLGNLGFWAVENLSQTMATGWDVGLSFITGQRTVYCPNLQAQWVGANEGWGEGLQEALLGIDISQSVATRYQLPKNSIFDSGVMGALEKTLSVELRAPDKAFYKASFNETLQAEMKAAGVTEPTFEMLEYAHYMGLYRTFQDDSVIANIMVGLKRTFNTKLSKSWQSKKWEVGKWGVGDMIIKFPKVPGNLASRGLEYSPLAFVSTIYRAVRAMLGKGFDQKSFVWDTSRATVGSVLYVGMGALLASLGIISAKRLKDLDAQEMVESVGLGAYKVNISALKRFVMSGFAPSAAQLKEGDTWISYDWFQPHSVGIAMGANMVDSENANFVDAIIEASNTLVEQPVLSGVQQLQKGESLVNNLGKMAVGIPASFVPTLLNHVKQLTDNVLRETRDPNYFKEAYNKVIYKIPGLSKTLPERVNTWGEKKEVYQAGSNNPFNVFLNPAFVTKYNPSSEAKLVLDIWKQSGETVQFPRKAPKSLMLGGKKRDLTPEEQRIFQQYIGTKTGILYRILYNDPMFMKHSDENKAKKLQGYLTDIYTAAKIKVLGYEPKKLSRDVRMILQDISGWWKQNAYKGSPSATPVRRGFARFIRP